jgi:RimJ/RimL family protein N-acetyltransferase
MQQISTARLLLRPWRPEDLDFLAAMNTDDRVMEFFPNRPTRDESQAMLTKWNDYIASNGHGFWACELKKTGDFIGIIGLAALSYETPFTPCTEVGWRLRPEFWGHGFASEGAKKCLEYGFDTLPLDQIVAQTAVGNAKSRRVMESIGMRYCVGEDYDHPKVPEGHPHRRHVLYRIHRVDFRT